MPILSKEDGTAAKLSDIFRRGSSLHDFDVNRRSQNTEYQFVSVQNIHSNTGTLSLQFNRSGT